MDKNVPEKSFELKITRTTEPAGTERKKLIKDRKKIILVLITVGEYSGELFQTTAKKSVMSQSLCSDVP